MKTKIKICGLRRKEDISYVNEFLPDFIGFVFYKKSKRYVSKEEAKELKLLLDKRIKAAGVFVNQEIDEIITLCKEEIIDIIQLHGDEDAEYKKQLKIRLSELSLKKQIPVIEAVRVKDRQDIENAMESQADYLLLDAYGKNSYGGSGEMFEHELIPKNMVMFFLAGGIKEDNIEAVIKKIHPFAVDISSGVETNGYKDREKIKNIMNIVRKIQEEEK